MQVAIVTGGSSGIGRAAAIRIAARGIGVILTYHAAADRALDTVRVIEKDGGTAVALPLDVGRTDTFPAFREAVVAALRDTWDRDTADFLVNNGGLAQAAVFEDTDRGDVRPAHAGPAQGPVLPHPDPAAALADGGAVVNTTSNSALPHVTEPGYSAYATMKGGLIVLTRYLAKELSGRGIRVNAVAPGSTRTRLGDNGFERFPEVIPALAAKTALGRVGEPDDIGVVIAALLADEGRWITAQTIEVSGGFNL